MSSLPKLTVPTYTLTIPSTKKKVKFRPFLSKEEKILMMIKQSKNKDEVLQAMKDIIAVCTFNKLDINILAMFDVEYIFLQLRAKAVGEVIDIDMKCANEIELPKADDHPAGVEPEKKECGNLVPFSINIEDIKVHFPKDHTNVIKLEKNIGITLRYPSINDIDILEDESKTDVDVINHLISNIFDKDNVYEVSETPKVDIEEFIDNINPKQIEDIRKKFFYSMPSLSYTVKYKCSKCGNTGEYTFKGINDFFSLG